MRKFPLVCNEVYHVMNKSIAGYNIFKTVADYGRIQQIMRYYSIDQDLPRFSWYLESQAVVARGFEKSFEVDFVNAGRHIQIIAYCIMPTHIHLVLRQLNNQGVETFMRKLLDSYTRYFNLRHQRRGPLWVGRFKNVLVENDDQLIHLTRYVHLNPVSAGLVNTADEWEFSSYKEYLTSENNGTGLKICDFRNLIEMKSEQYKTFVNEHAGHQKMLAEIKSSY